VDYTRIKSKVQVEIRPKVPKVKKLGPWGKSLNIVDSCIFIDSAIQSKNKRFYSL